MIEYISKKIVDGEIHKGKLLMSDKDIYQYGYILLINFILNIISSIVIGIIFDEKISVMVFLLSYIPLRTYAGGFHSKSNFRCFIISNLLIMAVCILVKCDFILRYSGWLVFVGIVVSGIIILKNAPVQCSNKQLSNLERNEYRDRARLCWSVESFLAIVLWKAGLAQSGLIIAMAGIILSIFIIIGKYSKKES